MTLVQSYRCNACGWGFGPIGVQPYQPSRPQVFRYCRDCKQGQSMVLHDPQKPPACVHCASTNLHDVQRSCPVCASADVGWS